MSQNSIIVRDRYRSKVWLIKRRKQGLKSPKISNTKWLSELLLN